MTTKFFHPSLVLLVLDPGSEIRDPGWVKIRIRDKHPGSATLQKIVTKLSKIWFWYLSRIRDPGFGKNLLRIAGPGVKKAPDPGSATLLLQFFLVKPFFGSYLLKDLVPYQNVSLFILFEIRIPTFLIAYNQKRLHCVPTNYF